MKKNPRRSFLVEQFHKGFVLTCVAVTLYGTCVLGLRGYRYFTEVKPQFEQKKLLEKRHLLAEGSSDSLEDKAPNLGV